MSAKNIKEEIVSAIKNAVGDNLDSVVLYGSRARGDSCPFSDWDIMVFLHNPPAGIDRYKILWKELEAVERTFDSEINPVVFDLDKLEFVDFLLNLVDGKMLLDKSGVVSAMKERIEENMSAGKIVRNEDGTFDYWGLDETDMDNIVARRQEILSWNTASMYQEHTKFSGQPRS